MGWSAPNRNLGSLGVGWRLGLGPLMFRELEAQILNLGPGLLGTVETRIWNLHLGIETDGLPDWGHTESGMLRC